MLEIVRKIVDGESPTSEIQSILPDERLFMLWLPDRGKPHRRALEVVRPADLKIEMLVSEWRPRADSQGCALLQLWVVIFWKFSSDTLWIRSNSCSVQL